MEYNHTLTIFGRRSNGLDSEACTYELDVDAEISESENIYSGSYTHAPEYSGGSSVDSIYYKGVDVTNFVMRMFDEDEIIDAIDCGCNEIYTPRMRESVENNSKKQTMAKHLNYMIQQNEKELKRIQNAITELDKVLNDLKKFNSKNKQT